jgi:hypothetical protein
MLIAAFYMLNLNSEVKSIGAVFAVEAGQAGATSANFGEIV